MTQEDRWREEKLTRYQTEMAHSIFHRWSGQAQRSSYDINIPSVTATLVFQSLESPVMLRFRSLINSLAEVSQLFIPAC